jgi:isochorismate hydrolase
VLVVDEATFDRSNTSHLVNLYEIDQKYGNVIGTDDAVEVLGRVDPADDVDAPADGKETGQ